MKLLRVLVLSLAGLLVAVPLTVSFAAQAQQQGAALTVKVGGKKVLDVADVTRVAVGDPAVADIRVGERDGIEVTGRSEGTTLLNVWRADGQKVSYQIVVVR